VDTEVDGRLLRWWSTCAIARKGDGFSLEFVFWAADIFSNLDAPATHQIHSAPWTNSHKVFWCFVRFPLHKSSEVYLCGSPILFTFWSANRSLSLSPQSYALFVHNFPQSRPVTAETNTLLRRPESVFTREFTRFQTLTFPSCLMMVLTWWCGWHDGGNANHEHCALVGRFLAKCPSNSNIP